MKIAQNAHYLSKNLFIFECEQRRRSRTGFEPFLFCQMKHFRPVSASERKSDARHRTRRFTRRDRSLIEIGLSLFTLFRSTEAYARSFIIVMERSVRLLTDYQATRKHSCSDHVALLFAY